MLAWGAVLALLATGGVFSEPGQVYAAGCAGGTPSDFNGDGSPDIAISDPEATVSGVLRAGRLTIVYGNGQGVDTISQETAGIPGAPERGDRYGFALATFDHNQDGCSDLVVGSPYEDIGQAPEAGYLHIVYGAPTGLGSGPATVSMQQGNGSGSVGNSVPQAEDWFGYSVAAGDTAAGEPYLIIGVPGESKDGFEDAGVVHYIRGSVNVTVHQGIPGVAGALERNDRFGYAVGSSPHHIAVGNPGEAIGTDTFSGGVQVLSHEINGDGVPDPLVGIDQDIPGLDGVAETGDRFGASIAVVPYRPAGASATTESIVAIGSPGEDTSTGDDAGRVVAVRVNAAGDVSQTSDIHQAVSGVTGVGEDGDYFGQHITAVNVSPDETGTASTVLLAAGIPGKDVNGTPDTGLVMVFGLVGAPGNSEAMLRPGVAGLPGTADSQDYLGTSLHATAERLYVGAAYGPVADRAVHAVPWENLTDGADQPISTYEPGQGGVPTDGKAFGAVTR